MEHISHELHWQNSLSALFEAEERYTNFKSFEKLSFMISGGRVSLRHPPQKKRKEKN
jgi:hypothetical protein